MWLAKEHQNTLTKLEKLGPHTLGRARFKNERPKAKIVGRPLLLSVLRGRSLQDHLEGPSVRCPDMNGEQFKTPFTTHLIRILIYASHGAQQVSKGKVLWKKGRSCNFTVKT